MKILSRKSTIMTEAKAFTIFREHVYQPFLNIETVLTLNSAMYFFDFWEKWCTVVSHIYAYDRAKTLSFISLIRLKNTEFENESNV